MSRQTTLNGTSNGRPNSTGSPTKAVFGNAAEVIHDVTELAELQAKLFVTNLKAVKKRLVVTLTFLILGLTVLLGLLPVVLIGIAELFRQYAELSPAMSFFASAGCAAILAGLLVAIGWVRLRKGFPELDESRRELNQNLQWIKTTLKGGGTQRHTAQHHI